MPGQAPEPAVSGQRPPADQRALPPRLLATGAVALITAGISWWLVASPGVQCDSLAPLTVLATLAAFVISICFRQMGRFPARASRLFLLGCILVAAATLFTDFRYVRGNRGFCDQLRQQLTQPTGSR
jgi:hypothetical protein